MIDQKPDPTQLAADFFEEYPRRFIYAVLDAVDRIRSGEEYHAPDSDELVMPWVEWCDRFGDRLDALLDPFTDELAAAIYNEITAFLVFLVLRFAGRLHVSSDIATRLVGGVPRATPFGAFSPADRVPAYNHADNPIEAFSERVLDLIPDRLPDAAKRAMIVIGVVMGRFTENVVRVFSGDSCDISNG